MVQFNLLPDVKLEYLRTQRMKRLVIAVSILVSTISLTLFIIMFVIVRVVQTTQISNLKKDIKTKTEQVAKIDNLDKMLTIQNQIKSLPGLHDQKPTADRLFTYIQQFTPQDVNITKLNIAFEDKRIDINGVASRLETVNKFVDTLKFTTFYTVTETTDEDGKKIEEKSDEVEAFSKVVLNTFSVDSRAGVTFNLSYEYDSLLFDYKKSVVLVVPKDKVTTRSSTELPLFTVPTKTESTEESQ